MAHRHRSVFIPLDQCGAVKMSLGLLSEMNTQVDANLHHETSKPHVPVQGHHNMKRYGPRRRRDDPSARQRQREGF
jgi:hypothetical protein